MSGFTCQDHAGAGHREGGERRVLEAEPDPALLHRAFPGVDDFGQARSAVDDVAPGSGGGPEVELAEQTLECLIRVGLEDEDRLARRQEQLVAHQEGVGGVQAGQTYYWWLAFRRRDPGATRPASIGLFRGEEPLQVGADTGGEMQPAPPA